MVKFNHANGWTVDEKEPRLMKTAEELSEEFPIQVPNPFNYWTDEAKEFKRQYREKYLAFIRHVQEDAKEAWHLFK